MPKYEYTKKYPDDMAFIDKCIDCVGETYRAAHAAGLTKFSVTLDDGNGNTFSFQYRSSENSSAKGN